MVFICQQSYLLLLGIPSLTHFHSRLKTFLFCKSSLPSLSFFFFVIHYMDSPRLFTVISEHIRFLLLVFLFLHFLVVGSVRQIKPTHVGFRAHVKIASRIVSCREDTRHSARDSRGRILELHRTRPGVAGCGDWRATRT